MSSQWWPAKESWWSHRTASRRGADCRTAKLGLKLGSSHRMAIYSQILWRTIGLGGTYFQTIMLVQWLKHAETTRDKPVITSVQSQAANMPASGWVLRLQLIVCNSEGYRFCHGKSSVLLCHYSDAPDGQPRMMLSYVCCFLSHSKNGYLRNFWAPTATYHLLDPPTGCWGWAIEGTFLSSEWGGGSLFVGSVKFLMAAIVPKWDDSWWWLLT